MSVDTYEQMSTGVSDITSIALVGVVNGIRRTGNILRGGHWDFRFAVLDILFSLGHKLSYDSDYDSDSDSGSVASENQPLRTFAPKMFLHCRDFSAVLNLPRRKVMIYFCHK